jgi:MFS family permease
MEFKFTGKLKTITYVLMAIGVLALVVGFVFDHSHGHQRWWSNLLINGFFFLAIALGALFFYALQYAAEVAWSAQLKRIFESMFAYIPIGGLVIIVVLLAGYLHQHHLYHWMDDSLYHEYMIEAGDNEVTYVDTMEAGAVANPNYDELIDNKGAYFSAPFFWGRTLAYLATFIIFARLFRKWSLEEDRNPSIGLHYKQYRRGALFLVFFAVFSSTLSWDWLMSIDTHWFSTLYGWYVFSGMWVTCMIFALVLTLYLRGKGMMPHINDSHIHDLGKWMFAISMLWSYLWFSQFMLIWYADIPEEVIYYVTRFEHYKVPFLMTFFINFAVPFYFLMARDAKRNPKFLVPVALIIFAGHFLDVYLLVTPGTMFSHGEFGLLEVGMFLGFLGLFTFVVLRKLAQAPLIPVNHPFREESEHLHI